MNKDLIKKRFSKSLESYDKNALIQQKMAETLFNMLDRKIFNDILEIGCGTGKLTRIAAQNLEYESYTALDIVRNCEKYIQDIDKNINFIECDMEDIVFKNFNQYDLILSNASMQWIGNLQEYIKNLRTMLKPNGIILFSVFGPENFREINLISNKSLNYYSISQLTEMFSEYNTVINEEIHIMAFKNPKEVLKHISFTGVNALEETFWTKADLKNFENAYNNICSNSPTLTYNPIYIKIG